MTFTYHQIVLGVTDKTQIIPQLNMVMEKLKFNLETNQDQFIEFAGRQTKYIAKLETRRFKHKGKLEEAIAHRTFKKSKRTEIFVAGQQAFVARANEEGVAPHLISTDDMDIKDWIYDKAPHLTGIKYLRVGYPHGGSHQIKGRTKNKFWGRTARIVEKDLDNMFAHYLEKAIKQS